LPNIFDIGRDSQSYLQKVNQLYINLNLQPFILLARPRNEVYTNKIARENFKKDLKYIIGKGLINLEIPWEDNKHWFDLMCDLKSNFPNIKLGSATIINKKSIDDSLKIGLDFSMMRTWQKDLYAYSIQKNYLLIPGLTKLKDLKEAVKLNCRMIKIFPIKNKEKNLNIKHNKNIYFIGAGDISLSDLKKYSTEGYSGLIIGSKGYDGKVFDPQILNWLKANI
tara:strand:- start:1191 stop:1859 length:669 start_codon:yes stop_codon:yes gene_type:complete